MTRLTTLLLAGTILPVFSLTPIATVSAQAPDQGERHGPRQHEGGGQRGDGQGEGRHQRQGAERREGGTPREQGAASGESKGHAAEEAPRGEGKRRAQGAEKERPNRAEGPRGDEPKGGRKAAEEGSKPAPAGRAQTREERGDERKERREMSRDREDAAPRGGAARDNAQTDRARGDREDRTRGNAERAGERGAGDRTRAGERDDRARDRQERANDPDRGDRTRAGDRNDRTRDNRDRAEDPRDNSRLRAGERGRDERLPPGDRNERRIGGPAVGAGPGFSGGFLPPTQARRLDDLRRDRREVREGDRVFIREPGRTIVQERGRAFIVHDETDRFRALGMNVRRERRGSEVVDVIVRPGGEQILTYTDDSGRMLRRVRRTRDGREIVIIDNAVGGRIGPYAEDVVALPPPPIRIPRDRYVVDYAAAGPAVIYDTLIAPPLAAPPRRYTLDQIRYSPDVRNYVRSVDINTINFDSGSWDVPAAATGKLEALASAINKAVDRNPNSVFLIEGYTDATGNPDDNLSLSDRRAQSVAEILTKDFKVPPENLTTQGYGQQNPRENTQGPSTANRRVVVRNISQLLAAGDEPATSGH